MILKQVIHQPETNSVEATWVDLEGNQVRCHSYADAQMDMLEDDLGAYAAEHAALIATVRANIKPPAPPTSLIPLEELVRLDQESSLSPRNLRDFILDTAEAIKQITAGSIDLYGTPTVVKVKLVETAAKVIRSKL